MTQRASGTPTISFSGFLRESLLECLVLMLLLLGLPACVWLMPPLVLLSALLIAGSVWAMQRLVGLFNLRQLTIPAFFYLLYVSIILVPGFFIFADETTASRWRFLFGIESVIITVPLGIWLASLFSGFNRQETADYYRQTVAQAPYDTSAKRLYLFFLAAACILVLMNLWEMPVIPLVFLIRNPGEFLTAAVMREDAFKLLDSHFAYAYYVLRGTVFPFLIMVSFGRYYRRNQPGWKQLFLVSLVLGILYASLTIEKSPVAAVLGLLGVFYYLLKGGRLGKVGALVLPSLFISFPLLVILLAYQGTEGGTLVGALQAIGQRLFYSPALVVYAYFEVFPSVIPFQHGASVLKLAHLLGWQTVDIPNSVGLYMTDGQGLDTISANSCFIGNANADFGLPGVVVYGVLAGFLMQLLHVYFFRRHKTIVSLAAYALCMWACGLLVASALTTQMLSGGVAFALILGWLFREQDGVLTSP